MKRFDVYLVNLDPTVGSEMKKSRPGVIVSPEEINEYLETVIIVPLTTGRSFPFRPATRFRGTPGIAAIDQVRAVDRRRLSRRLGALDAQTSAVLLKALGELFAP